MKYKICMSLLIGTGLVGLTFVTMDLTWIGGVVLLMPGIALLGVLPYRPSLDSTAIPMLVANAFLYSLAAFAIILIAGRSANVAVFRRMAKITAGLVVAAMVVGWASTQALSHYGLGSCQNEAVEYISSPGGRFRAVIFYRDCGATTGFITNVSVLKGLETVNHSETGNLLVAAGTLPVQLKWTSETHLTVMYPSGSEPRLVNRSYGGVTVDYVEKAGAGSEQ